MDLWFISKERRAALFTLKRLSKQSKNNAVRDYFVDWLFEELNNWILINNYIMAKTHPAVIAIGKNKGHPVTKFKGVGKKQQKVRPASTKGRLGKRVKLIRQVIG